MLDRAWDHVAHLDRDMAQKVVYLGAAGFATAEIARELEVPWPEVNRLREVAGVALVDAFDEAGYTPGEIARTLGIATPVRNSG